LEARAMSDELDRLWALHVLDEQAGAHAVRLRALPESRAHSERQLAAERMALEAHKAHAADALKVRRQLEKDIEAVTVEERKFQSQLPAIKKNEEYTALLHEIQGVRARRSELETRVLERMEEEDALAAGRPALEKAVRTAEEEGARRAAAFDREETQARAALAELEAQRAAQLEGLPAATRARYERVHGSRDGRAVVAIVKNACGGCFRSLSPQALQEAKRRDRVLICEGCGRMLVWPPEGA
jgi:predicted  nucleic acid-binding Zn-ribbon protein